ncbi:AtpZ/AtpI family protein [Thalassorhabdus alkalitolerans]|uniref:AtpZ/AtpI family protein n=1 Tax=Thalassorhabdus alkalitolerans TaxID=2282697 RepID=A0ABW0YJD7_9BACI|nr:MULTISPECIES: AtpZ/AtpI family protein [Bacillaceae]
MSNQKKPPQDFRAIALMSSVLSYLVGPLLVGIFGGRWLDGLLGTEPLFLVLGILGGLGAGVYGLVRLLGHYLGDDDE